MIQTSYNPDVLSCIANLSNDEVFTPPNLANQLLDHLPIELWSNKDAKFLDPVSKSGVFLREIAKRLMIGLEPQIPEKQERINHIYKNQLFGIAITELTSMLSRRSIYCSKTANSKYSICNAFDNEQGNIIYERLNHEWKNGTCTYCGANKDVYDRSESHEKYAYQFIHTKSPERMFNMKFDVIIGNPPYQLNDGGGLGTSAMPIYQKFVDQAKRLNPRYLVMIIPARWYSGGKGLDTFRDSMLNDDRIRTIVDFPEAIDCFPGVQIKGGVCYFIWEKDNPGDCKVITSRKGKIISEMERPLLENGNQTFIRYNEAISILQKVRKFKEKSISSQVSARKPFGLDSTVFRTQHAQSPTSIKIYQNGGIGFTDISKIKQNISLVNRYKVLVSKAGSGSDSFPHTILGKPFIASPGTACTETYLVIGDYDTQQECANLCSYISTKFFRFLILLKKNTQNAAKGVYEFVPIQNFDEEWTDEKLYSKYNLSDSEIKFIDSMVRPMELGD